MRDNSFYGPLEDPAANAGYDEGHPQRVGFFTDTSICIGCKACEVACKEWNMVPDDGFNLLGMSFDNTGELSANTWRHVAFIEQPADARSTDTDGKEPVDLGMPGLGQGEAQHQDRRQAMADRRADRDDPLQRRQGLRRIGRARAEAELMHQRQGNPHRQRHRRVDRDIEDREQ